MVCMHKEISPEKNVMEKSYGGRVMITVVKFITSPAIMNAA